MLEKDSKVYAKGARAVYDALVAHYDAWVPQIRGRVPLGAFFFHYLPSDDEEKQVNWIGGANIMTSIKRPATKPQVTQIPQIRAHFCFDFAPNNVLRMRRLSCHCDNCLARNWPSCTERKKNPWKSLTLEKKAGLTLSSRSSFSTTRKAISLKRQELAAACRVGEYIALEAADDLEGFAFWLAMTCAPGNSWTYEGKTKVEKGVTFRKQGVLCSNMWSSFFLFSLALVHTWHLYWVFLASFCLFLPLYD